MAAESGPSGMKDRILAFWRSEEQIPSVVREIVSVLVTVGVIVAILLLVCGTWPAIVTIESESMVPHMNVGDLVLVVAPDRFGGLQTYREGEGSNRTMFGMAGDVIIYKPNGDNSLHPIIHRALYWVEEGDEVPMMQGTRQIQYTAPHEGYITKGDNNPVIDQIGWTNYRGLGGPIEPIKREWVIGKALYSVPLVGYLPLNIGPVIVIVIVIMILHELYLRSREQKEQGSKKKRRK